MTQLDHKGTEPHLCSIGGFEDGQTANYNGSVIVERALQLSQPVVYVSVNYRYVAKS